MKTEEYRGSGVVVEQTDRCVRIVTNRHVAAVKGRSTTAKKTLVAYIGSRWRVGTVTHVAEGECDLALIEVPFSGGRGTVAQLSANEPATDATIELRSHVGGLHLSQQYTTLLEGRSEDTRFVTVPVVDGQSGGGAYDSHGKLVGIIWGNTTTGPKEYGAAIVSYSCLRRFWNDCGLGSRGPPVRINPPPKPVPTPPPVKAVLDYDRLAEEIIKRMAKDVRFRGPQGPQGKPADALPHNHKITIKLAKGGKIVDTQVYDLDEPIVLDFRKFMREQ